MKFNGSVLSKDIVLLRDNSKVFQINCSSFIYHRFIVHLLPPVGAPFASCKRLFFTLNNRSPNSVYIQGLYINQISKIQKKKNLPGRILNLISINIKFNIHLYIFDINWALYFFKQWFLFSSFKQSTFKLFYC